MPDLTDWRPKFQCKQCTQQTTGVCSAIFLSKVIAGDGVKYAYCNDNWLVVGASGHPGVFSANLTCLHRTQPTTSDNGPHFQ